MNPEVWQQYLEEFVTAFAVLDFNAGLVALAVLGIAVILLFISLRRLRQKRVIAAGIHGCAGICCLAGTLVILLFLLNLHTYHRLTYEEPVAKLTFSAQGPQQYRVTLDYLNPEAPVDQKRDEYILSGDEWQLDARVLRWKPFMQLLGLNAMYRLERLNGRYTSVSEELSRERTVYALARDRGLDVWALTQRYRHWLDWVDAYYGSAAYMPMADNAEFIVVITQSGLVARPDNAIAEQLLRGW